MGYPSYQSGYESNPSIVWINHKEIWVDTAALADPNISRMILLSIGDEVITTQVTYPVNARTVLEITIAQSSVNDLEDANYSIDNILVENNEFLDLLEGDSVRLNVLNRAISNIRSIVGS